MWQKPTAQQSPCWIFPLLLSVALANSGCATVSGKPHTLGGLALGVSLGGMAGAGGGAMLSPNDESRAINAIVFGLTGALLGGGTAAFSNSYRANESDKISPLKAKELGSTDEARQSTELGSEEALPEFLKKRFRPVVIEQFTEADRVSEEGTLHEPHKAYRIKRPAELIARPTPMPSPSNVGEAQ